MTKLESIIDELPDGPFWLTGETFREILEAIAEDRVFLASGSGDEIQTPNGRCLNIRVASSFPKLHTWIGVAGIVHEALAGLVAIEGGD